MKPKRVLVACEYSGEVRRAFRKKGFNAWSCDLLPPDDGSPYHIMDDVTDWLGAKWDLMIGHPPCTYLCNSGVGWLKTDPTRMEKVKEGSEFLKMLWRCDIPFIAIENPIPHKYGELPGYDQLIQPYQFGHAERKATCLWLKNLPPLKPTNDVKKEMESLPKNQAQRIHYTSPSKDRSKIRSKTFSGIAEAMAEQWGHVLMLGCTHS